MTASVKPLFVHSFFSPEEALPKTTPKAPSLQGTGELLRLCESTESRGNPGAPVPLPSPRFRDSVTEAQELGAEPCSTGGAQGPGRPGGLSGRRKNGHLPSGSGVAHSDGHTRGSRACSRQEGFGGGGATRSRVAKLKRRSTGPPPRRRGRGVSRPGAT